MRASALALALLASCAGGAAYVPPPETRVTLPAAARADDRAVALAAGCLLRWRETPARDRCAELRLRAIDDPIARDIARATDVPGILALLDHADPRARAVGVLAAAERTANAAVAHRERKTELLPLFGVSPPETRRAIDLLAQIELAADMAGHPVLREGRTLEARERVAWASARQGFADRLRALFDRVSDGEIQRAMVATANRLDLEYRAREIDAPIAVPSDLATLAASCWLGSTWGEGTARRCEAFAHAAYADPERAYENGDALRAAEPEALIGLGPKVLAIAAAAVDAKRIPALVESSPAIGWLFVLHRLQSDRPLTEEAELVSAVFRVRGDSWLDTFEQAAKAGGHPLLPADLVEDDSDPSDAAIQRLVRTSVNEAIADKLRKAPADGELRAAVREVVDRLDSDYRAVR